MMAQAAPKISVVMGVYNGARYLRDAVQSVLDQTFDDFEFLIVDDASTDATAEILKEFSDPRIKVYVNEENEGLTRCLIKGCDLARGEYIARMDADDVSLPERLEKEVAFLDSHTDHGVVGCWCCCIDADGSFFGTINYPLQHEDIEQALAKFNSIIHGSVMFRADFCRRIGGYRKFFQYAQDYDLWLRAAEQTRLSNLPDLLYQHRHHHHKIAVRRIYTQRVFSHLARRLAELRRNSGVDPLAEEDYTAVNELLDEAGPRGLLRRQAMISQYYANLARDYGRLRMKYLSRLLVASFLHNPLGGALWKFLLSAEFRGRIQSGLRRKIRAMTRGGL